MSPSTCRKIVAELRAEIAADATAGGSLPARVFVPQTRLPGREAEVDWGQFQAVVLIGAQAVYLRTAGRLPTYQPYTTDADIVLNPARLLDNPPLGRSMTDASFVLTAEPGDRKSVV